MMRIWNPSEFTIGKAGRSNCPKWRGQDFPFEPNESRELPDACGYWLISSFGYYGLVSLPDRNVVTDPAKYDEAVERLHIHGIKQLFKWATRVIDQYREEALKCVDSRVRPPRPNEFVKLATKIQKRYEPDIQLSDPGTIEDHKLMREILGTVVHDSDKLVEQALTQELIDKEKNRQQYAKGEDALPKINIPGEPTTPKPISAEAQNRVTRKKQQISKNKARRPKSKPPAQTTMKVPVLDDGIIMDDGEILDDINTS